VRLDPPDARQRLSAARVARLATVGPDGRPHVVPVCFVPLGDALYSAVDDKPKTTAALARLANVATQPSVALLADYYDEDWRTLWWVRADGGARLVADGAERDTAVVALRDKYPQYRDHRLVDAVLAIDVTRWSGWAAAPGTNPAPGR
jgi:PPOX class probable F420-dependent enzyme